MKERKILQNKAYLYLTEFFSGMALGNVYGGRLADKEQGMKGVMQELGI